MTIEHSSFPQKVNHGKLWHAVYVNVHLVAINSVLVTEVFPWRILPQWRQFIKKLRKMGFDSWNWESIKEGFSSSAEASSFYGC